MTMNKCLWNSPEIDSCNIFCWLWVVKPAWPEVRNRKQTESGLALGGFSLKRSGSKLISFGSLSFVLEPFTRASLPNSCRAYLCPKGPKAPFESPLLFRMEHFAEDSEFLLARRELSQKLAHSWRHKHKGPGATNSSHIFCLFRNANIWYPPHPP